MSGFVNHSVQQGSRSFGSRRLTEKRPTAVPAIPEERELGDDRQAASSFNERTIHAPVVIVENPEVHDLACQLDRIFRGISLPDCHQGDNAGSHFGDRFFTHAYSRRTDPLQNGAQWWSARRPGDPQSGAWGIDQISRLEPRNSPHPRQLKWLRLQERDFE